jgi:hypothetical protein
MSILVYQGSVILSGDITQDDTYFRTADAMASKASFPDAELLPLSPPSAGRWGYVNGAFVDLDAADVAAAAALQDAIDARNVDEAVKARQARAVLLGASDWTQVADAPVDKAAWAAYRQALRDISAQTGFPATIDWPVAP